MGNAILPFIPGVGGSSGDTATLQGVITFSVGSNDDVEKPVPFEKFTSCCCIVSCTGGSSAGDRYGLVIPSAVWFGTDYMTSNNIYCIEESNDGLELELNPSSSRMVLTIDVFFTSKSITASTNRSRTFNIMALCFG